MSVLDFLISPAAAQAAPAAQQNSLLGLAFPIVLLAVMFFLMIRPQMKRAKELREMHAKMQKGDEVLTNGGIAGRIDEIGEHFVVVEIADGVRARFQKGAISAILPKGTLKSV